MIETSQWWPSDLGSPAVTGSAGDFSFVYFPDKRRLAVRQNGRAHLFDTGDKRISGFRSQDDGKLVLETEAGLRRLDSLRRI